MKQPGRSFTKASTALLILLCIVGCSPDVVIELFNNTGEPIFISVNGATTALDPNTSMLISGRKCHKLEAANRSGLSWSYRVLQPSHSTDASGRGYYHGKRFHFPGEARLTLLFQINPDHRIFALPEGMGFPGKGDIAQPYRFPLEPSMNEKITD